MAGPILFYTEGVHIFEIGKQPSNGAAGLELCECLRAHVATCNTDMNLVETRKVGGKKYYSTVLLLGTNAATMQCPAVRTSER
jgi:hypothetical protein